eukprot:403339242
MIPRQHLANNKSQNDKQCDHEQSLNQDGLQDFDNVENQVKPNRKFSFIGILLIIVTVFTTAAILPLSVALPLDSTLLKLTWRNTNMIPYFILISIYDLFTKYKSFKVLSIVRDKSLALELFLLGVSFMLMQIAYILSGQYTIMSHASIFSNLGGPFVVIYRAIIKKPVHKYEYLGLFIAFVGTIVSILDKDVQKVDSKNQRILFGDICGVLSSISSCYYFEQNSIIIKKVPSSITVLVTVFISTVLIICYGIIFDTFTFDLNRETGVFGFFDRQYFLYTSIVVGLFCGTVSLYCAALSLKYYSAIVLLIAFLFEPLISQMISYLMKIDKAPGLLTYIGGVFTLVGILFVIFGGQKISTKK